MWSWLRVGGSENAVGTTGTTTSFRNRQRASLVSVSTPESSGGRPDAKRGGLTRAYEDPLDTPSRTSDLLLAKQVRLLVVTWTVVQICAVTRHFDFQWLATFCILQHSLTVLTRDARLHS
jgi:hypothetical protein